MENYSIVENDCIDDFPIHKCSSFERNIDSENSSKCFLLKGKEFDSKYCAHCHTTFDLLVHRRINCNCCQLFVCRACAIWRNNRDIWICKNCEQQNESWAWFYKRLKSNVKHFGAAKEIGKICKTNRLSDCENDSGYGPCTDLKPNLIPVHSQQNFNSIMAESVHRNLHSSAAIENECAEDEEDILNEEDEETEIHHSIETIAQGLLGSSLDEASVDLVYINCPEYNECFSMYHNKLTEAIRNLSYSLHLALHNLPHCNNNSPTASHAVLKCLISELVAECQNLPFLKCNNVDDQTESISSIDVDIFSSYEGLVASAIINKVVEDNQAKFLRNESYSDKNDNNKEYQAEGILENNAMLMDASTSEENNFKNESSFTEHELPLEYVQVEEVEEITREFADSDDDILSNNSSSCYQSVSTDRNNGFLPYYLKLNECYVENEGKVPFPELGLDLVERNNVHNDLENDVSCRTTATTNWEDNWLFRKKKNTSLHNAHYNSSVYHYNPPCMLIPCPSLNTVDVDVEDLSSELSESHSIGSLDFSTDSSNSSDNGVINEDFECLVKVSEACIASEEIAQGTSQDTIVDDGAISKLNKNYEQNELALNETSEGPCYNVETKENVLKEDFGPSHIKDEFENDSSIRINENKEHDLAATLALPPKPGTIAEREHKKWLNAVPMKNNPYSAENISKRYKDPNRGIQSDRCLSLEEIGPQKIEKQLQTKLDCGLKSIDGNLYRRDYYVHDNAFDSKSRLEKCPSSIIIDAESYHSVPDEALNSFEEKIYISAGKLFTSDTHVRRLERELKDLSLDSSLSSYDIKMVQNAEQSSPNEINKQNLPCVKRIATKFNWPVPDLQEPSMSSDYKMEDEEKVKKARPCIKVHSLTARSLSREFRDQARKNIPKQMNRLSSLNSVAIENVEHGTHNSKSASNSIVVGRRDSNHGYVSDDSSCSLYSSGLKREKSSSVLKRASYWERRVEQSLLSDSSVNEEFPG